ncbi:FAD-dependent oxidoreductase, partial [bacterium]|nr:FAD-dependent oxidoreductase [bacterium]
MSPSKTDMIWLEAEQFQNAGGWINDCQFMGVMGSPYLLAHGLGKPVEDAVTVAPVSHSGTYRLWVRCKDWLPAHSPGRFQVLVDGQPASTLFGKTDTKDWQWVPGGDFELAQGQIEIRLHDRTGWWGRCDAIVLADDSFRPANDLGTLHEQRIRFGGLPTKIRREPPFDLVVAGAGPAGMAAAVAAGRLGCRVALIHDRPVVGGNASSEIQIPPMGYIGQPPDKVNVTGLTEEFFGVQAQIQNQGRADWPHLEAVVRAEKNLSLFLDTRITGVEMAGSDRIASVLGMHVRSGERMAFEAPLFIDCTGDAWVGYYAGAEYRIGQEARSEFNESLAPDVRHSRTHGNTLYNARIEDREAEAPFIRPEWAYEWTRPEDFEPTGSHKRLREVVRPANFDAPAHGKGRNPQNDPSGAVSHMWWVEHGGMLDIIQDAEEIRDELFRISLGLWDYAKNHNPATMDSNRKRELVW